MLGATGIEVDGQPVFQFFIVEGGFFVVGAGVAQEIPGGAHEGVHGVRLALGRRAALGALGVDELLVVVERGFARGLELGVFGE